MSSQVSSIAILLQYWKWIWNFGQPSAVSWCVVRSLAFSHAFS